MPAETHDFETLEKGKEIYKKNKEFVVQSNVLLNLFSLYISFDPEYNYNKSYLNDKIIEFSREMRGYYRKECIIESATQKWVREIPNEKRVYMNNIVIEFDEIFKFSYPFERLELLKLPSLKEIKSRFIKIKCLEQYNGIVDFEKISIKNENDELSIKSIYEILLEFLDKVVINLNSRKGEFINE